ncbi:hypothetical protein M422DRAFT_243611 [Sphaerobolus stellatus SS14]|nr:hypothetical protein M422DRAFT_243611 [Sphaerobolus stellatus SS14]
MYTGHDVQLIPNNNRTETHLWDNQSYLGSSEELYNPSRHADSLPSAVNIAQVEYRWQLHDSPTISVDGCNFLPSTTGSAFEPSGSDIRSPDGSEGKASSYYHNYNAFDHSQNVSYGYPSTNSVSPYTYSTGHRQYTNLVPQTVQVPVRNDNRNRAFPR